MGVLICPCSFAKRLKTRVSFATEDATNANGDSLSDENNATNATGDSLIDEYNDPNMGVAFSMVSPAMMEKGWWMLTDQPNRKYQAFHSIMTRKQPMGAYRNRAYGLVFHITKDSGFWKCAQAIDRGSGKGKIVGGRADGGSHTTPAWRKVATSMGKDYSWFRSQVKGILAQCYPKSCPYNEFINAGFPRKALAGIFHNTARRGPTPSDGSMCQFFSGLSGSRWPIYAYNRHGPSLTIERYINC